MNVTSVVKYSEINPNNSIKSKLENKNNSLQFLPQVLDNLSKDKIFTYKGQKLKSAYAIDIVHNLILKYYFKKENKFHLLATILKEKYGSDYNIATIEVSKCLIYIVSFFDPLMRDTL